MKISNQYLYLDIPSLTTVDEMLTTLHIARKQRYFLYQKRCIAVNNTVITQSCQLSPHDELAILLEDDTDFIAAWDQSVEICYEDALFLIVHKPYGMLVHSDGVNTTHTLCNAVKHYYDTTNQKHLVRPIHRLDIETSGLLMFCKQPLFQPMLDHMLETKQIHRDYLAIVQGHLSKSVYTASRIKVEIAKHDVISSHEMIRDEKGVFRYAVLDNLENATYVYLVRNNGEWKETIDPYAISSTSNSLRSVVIDPAKIKVAEYPLADMKSSCDAIIYEASVRDFTSQKGIGITHPSTYLGFVEENAQTKAMQTGFSYLKSLGITHVQLMPVLDFGSVDENYPFLFYNWGYDPVQWGCLEGSFASDASNPYARIFEFIKLVETCHKNGIRVNLDVVFNHVYDMPKNALHILVPNYYFQMNSYGEFSNGTYCGNDVDSKRKMCSKLIVDICKNLCKMYKIDGFRFDLMGILDVTTINKIHEECIKINPNFMLYGEGWDMPSLLVQEERASINNSAKMPYVAHFSDRFRDVVKGNTSQNEVNVKGYCSGSLYLVDTMKNVLIGSCDDFGYNRMFIHPRNVVNYVECHDNMTCWDKLKECCKEDTREIRIQIQKMCIAATLLAQGIPFLHSGQEFARTKHGRHNTYNDTDEINKIDYVRKDLYQDIVTNTKALIEIRKRFSCLRYDTAEDILKHVDLTDIDHKVIVYRIHDAKEDVAIFFNPTKETSTYLLESEYYMLYKNGPIEQERCQNVEISAYSTIVMSKY